MKVLNNEHIKLAWFLSPDDEEGISETIAALKRLGADSPYSNSSSSSTTLPLRTMRDSERSDSA